MVIATDVYKGTTPMDVRPKYMNPQRNQVDFDKSTTYTFGRKNTTKIKTLITNNQGHLFKPPQPQLNRAIQIGIPQKYDYKKGRGKRLQMLVAP